MHAVFRHPARDAVGDDVARQGGPELAVPLRIRGAAGGGGEIRGHRIGIGGEVPRGGDIPHAIERRDAIPRVRIGTAPVDAPHRVVSRGAPHDHEFHGGNVDEHHPHAPGDGVDIGIDRLGHDTSEYAIAGGIDGFLRFGLGLGAIVEWLLLRLFKIDDLQYGCCNSGSLPK